MTSDHSGDDLPAVFPTAVPEVPNDLWARVLTHAVDPASEALPGLVPDDDDLASSWAGDDQHASDQDSAAADAEGDAGHPSDHGLDHSGLDHSGLDDHGFDVHDARPLADQGDDGAPVWHDQGAGDHHEPGDAW